MKIITFMGGLGNTICEYAYYLFMKNKYPKEKFYAFYPKAGLALHNGFELDRHFDVDLPPRSAVTDIVAYTLFYTNKIWSKLHLPLPFTSTLRQRNDDALFHSDYFQNIDVMVNPFPFDFKDVSLNEKNREVVEVLQKPNSVAVHIRRGDYLSPVNARLFGGICTDDYYDAAIRKGHDMVDSPRFVFFSNDADYVMEKYKFPDMLIVDWNKGEESWLDMYLMSKARYMILANSTFSYCAARLNKNVEDVICPIRWNNGPCPPKLIMPHWIVISPEGKEIPR